MIDFGWLGMLDVDRDITLAAAIDLTTGSRDVDPIRHVPGFEFFDEFVHHRLDHTGGVGTGNIAMQPPLGMRNHCDRV